MMSITLNLESAAEIRDEYNRLVVFMRAIERALAALDYPAPQAGIYAHRNIRNGGV